MKVQQVLMTIIRCRAFLIVVVTSLCLVMTGMPAQALLINVAGSLDDLDSDGSNLDEQGAVNAAITIWESLILTPRVFNLSVSTTARAAGGGLGGISAFDAQNVPTAGFIEMGDRNDWFVDDAPLDNSEFIPDSDFDNNHRHYVVSGPSDPLFGTLDLFSVALHEIGHALGWHSFGSPFFNPRFVALMDPQPANFSVGTTVLLRSGSFVVPLRGDGIGTSVVNELSHTSFIPGEIPGWNRTLMGNVNAIGERYLPGDVDFQMFEFAYGDTVVPEPSTYLLFAVGILGIIGMGYRQRKKAS